MITIEFNREAKLFTAYYDGTMLAFNSDLKRLFRDIEVDAEEIESLIKATNDVE